MVQGRSALDGQTPNPDSSFCPISTAASSFWYLFMVLIFHLTKSRVKRTEEGYLGSVSVSNSISGLDSWVMSRAAFDFMDLSEARNRSRYLGMGDLLRLSSLSRFCTFPRDGQEASVLPFSAFWPQRGSLGRSVTPNLSLILSLGHFLEI